MTKGLVVLGFGGHARSVADVALAVGYAQLYFVDDNARPGENFLGHPVGRTIDHLDLEGWDFIPALGDNHRRSQQFEQIERLGGSLVSVVSPLASLGAGSVVSAGCFVGHHAHIGPMARIGRGCIINTGAIVEHESHVDEFSHVAVKAAIAGRSSLGKFSMLGAGAVVIDGVAVGDQIVVGAGGVVSRSLDFPGTYVGVPVRRVE